MKRREREDHRHGNTALRKGTWSEEEDRLLRKYVDKYGEGNWKNITSKSGLRRCRKSCRLRWLNYLRPDLKRGGFGVDEDDLIVRLHRLLGNRWTLIAGRIPGRTPNDIKNYWNTYLSKKIQSEANKGAALVKHHNTCTSAMNSETLGGEFETCSEQKQGEGEEEEDTASFWRRLLLEGEYRERDLIVKNKERLQVEEEGEEEEEEEDTASFWRRLLLEGEYRERDLIVKNKEVLQVEEEEGEEEEEEDDLFQGLNDLLHDVDILDSFA